MLVNPITDAQTQAVIKSFTFVDQKALERRRKEEKAQKEQEKMKKKQKRLEKKAKKAAKALQKATAKHHAKATVHIVPNANGGVDIDGQATRVAEPAQAQEAPAAPEVKAEPKAAKSDKKSKAAQAPVNPALSVEVGEMLKKNLSDASNNGNVQGAQGGNAETPNDIIGRHF